MKFIFGDEQAAGAAIAQRISGELLNNKRVLWLISGGSNVVIEAAVMRELHQKAAKRLAGLAILPMDERYGPPGHAASNTEALRQAGFQPGNASWIDILAQNTPFEQTISFYTDAAATALANAQVVIGQFGIGVDGHIAGLLPGSPACQDDSATVAGYEWSDYTRLTLTPSALLQVTVGYAPTFGPSKKQALERLRQNTEPLAKLPAHLLYDIPEMYVYNDQLETKE